MKKYMFMLSAAILLGCINLVNAQIKTPAPSPLSKIEQEVGLATVTVEYSRPGVKGRKIFGNGGLLPYGKMWRTGANNCTKVRFSEDVSVGGKELKKGAYALYMTPNAGAWDVYFYNDISNWGLPKEWEESKVAAHLKITPQASPISFETMTFDLGNLTNEGADLRLMWENTIVSIPVSTGAAEKVEDMIKKTLQGPSTQDYYAAGRWYLDNEIDLNQAYEWIHKANEKDPKFWTLRQEALALSKLGRKKEAIEAAKKSMEMAKEAGNDDYIRMNEASIKEWSM